MTGFGQARDRRSAGITEPQQLGGLVEGLAGGVVQRLAEDAVVADAAHVGEQRVPARDQQRREGKGRRVGLQHGGEQVPLHMVYPDGRHPQA